MDGLAIERMASAVGRRSRVGVRKARARLSNARRPVILMYHRIADDKFDPWGLAVAPELFADHLSWLSKNRTPIPLAKLAELHRRGDLPDDAVAITFDDGYACTATVAAPLLNRYGIPATIFIPVGLVGRKRLYWWDELGRIVMSDPRNSIRFEGQTFELGERQKLDGIWPRDNRKRTPRQKAFFALWTNLKPLPLDQIEKALTGLRATHTHAVGDDAIRLMTEDEVRSIRSDNIEFGSHSLTHVSLPSLNRAQKAREIQGSIAGCETLVGTRPVTFAYPFGEFDAESEALVAEACFACACTVQPRAIGPDDDLFALPRIKVGNWTGRQLGHELAYAGYERARVPIEA